MKTVFLSDAYLNLLSLAMRPGEIAEITDICQFLIDLKLKLRDDGRDDIFNALILEEVRMIEASQAKGSATSLRAGEIFRDDPHTKDAMEKGEP